MIWKFKSETALPATVFLILQIDGEVLAEKQISSSVKPGSYFDIAFEFNLPWATGKYKAKCSLVYKDESNQAF